MVFRKSFALLVVLIGLGFASTVFGADESALDLQQKFHRKYQQYLGADSQMSLPFTLVDASDWKRLQESGRLEKIYSEPGVYYNAKVYTFTLFRAGDSGEYYMNAKGGFWGMDELSYGPLAEKDFE